MIFRRAATRGPAAERAAYNEGCHVFWQWCAWADAAYVNPSAVKFTEDTAFCNHKPNVMQLDSPTAQKDDRFLKFPKEHYQTDVQFLP